MPDLSLFFRSAPRRTVRRRVFRLCPRRYQNSTLSQRGAFLYGARYNVAGYFGALYTSLEIETARREMARYYTVTPRDRFVIATILVRLTQVVDLTSKRLLSRVGAAIEDLTGDAYVLPRQFGLSAWESGVEALLVPSAALPGATNLVLFLDNQYPRWRIELSGLGEQPQPAS